jgi:hypothetical protein
MQATKPTKQAKATKPAAQTPAPAATFASMAGALASASTVAVPTTAQVPAVAVQVPATYAGLPFAQLTKTQQSFATAKHAPSMPKVPSALTIVGAKAYKVRTGNNAAWWQAMQAAGCASAQGATPAQLQDAVASGALCPKFLGYAVARGWVVAAQA